MRAIACVGTTVLFVIAGCASNSNVARVERENAILKEKVTTLEAQLAELKAARTPITINGLTLTGPEVGEVRWTAKLIRWGESVRALDGSNTYASLGGTYAALGGARLVSGAVGNVTSAGHETTWRLSGVGTIEVGQRSTIGTAATTSTTTRSATTSAAPVIPVENR